MYKVYIDYFKYYDIDPVSDKYCWDGKTMTIGCYWDKIGDGELIMYHPETIRIYCFNKLKDAQAFCSSFTIYDENGKISDYWRKQAQADGYVINGGTRLYRR